MRTIHSMLPRLALTLSIASLLLAVGCGSDKSPTGPADDGVTPDPGTEIKTPKSLIITKVSVSTFGGKGGDGSWDASLTVSKRRPDLYVALHSNSRSNAPNYVSNIVDDAFSGAGYDFTASSAGVGLPRTFSYNTKVVVALMDDDGLSADDYIGGGTLDPSKLYRRDNATTYYGVFFGSNGTKFSISARWGY